MNTCNKRAPPSPPDSDPYHPQTLGAIKTQYYQVNRKKMVKHRAFCQAKENKTWL